MWPLGRAVSYISRLRAKPWPQLLKKFRHYVFHVNDPVGFSLKQALSYSLLSIDFLPSLNRVSQLLLSQPLAWSFGTQQPQLLIFICPPTYLACKRSRRKVLLQSTPPLHGVGSILPDGDAVFYFLASSHCTFGSRDGGGVYHIRQGHSAHIGSLLSTRWLSEKNHSLLEMWRLSSV